MARAIGIVEWGDRFLLTIKYIFVDKVHFWTYTRGMVSVLRSVADIKRLTKPALRTFFRIADVWNLNRSDQMALLGLTATSTYQKWKADRDGRLTSDVLERISHVFGIYKALQILFPETHIADSWIKRTNTGMPFRGHSPLDHIRQGKLQDLLEIRNYLDSYRGS